MSKSLKIEKLINQKDLVTLNLNQKIVFKKLYKPMEINQILELLEFPQQIKKIEKIEKIIKKLKFEITFLKFIIKLSKILEKFLLIYYYIIL